jgi:signal transduction histidine kinase
MAAATPGGAASQVLIVDDDQSLADNLAEIVETLGARTTIAPDQRSALQRAAEADFDVALIDVRLPDGDGIDLLAPLRERSPFIEIVLITGNATLEGAMAAVRGGAFAYVMKPFSPPELLDTVRRARAQAALYREREQLRLELEVSERRHRNMIESAPSFVLSLDEAGRITAWNRRLEEITGFTRAEMLGRPGGHLVSEAGQPHQLPVKGGPARLVEWHRSEVHDGGGAVTTYAIGIDVTGEQEMLRRTLRAERLAAVGTMAAGFAHEVLNPLNSASLQLTLLERRVNRGDESPETILSITQIVKDEIQRLDRMVRDFLSFARPRPIDVRAVDVNDLSRSVVALIVPEAETIHVDVTTELDATLGDVSADAERLRQVLLNLVRNALEAMPGGGRLTVRSRPGAAGTAEIDVEDTGPGFAEDLPVFDAFFTTKEKGTGLGLAIVHRIVTDHGGTVRVRSAPGGTCFTITLPTVSSAPTATPG